LTAPATVDVMTRDGASAYPNAIRTALHIVWGKARALRLYRSAAEQAALEPGRGTPGVDARVQPLSKALRWRTSCCAGPTIPATGGVGKLGFRPSAHRSATRGHLGDQIRAGRNREVEPVVTAFPATSRDHSGRLNAKGS
jgi:hypothetical protein